MARPPKQGLDYFPMDVGFLRDKKVRLLKSEFGASSVLFVLYVLGRAYEGDGYFLRWDKDECLIVADELRENPTYISEVLQGCLSRSLFDQGVFQVSGVLTSAGIQRRYLRGCEKRDVIQIASEYWLLNVDDKNDVPASTRAKLTFFSVSGEKNGVTSPGNQDKVPDNPQRKGKESKGDESKEDVGGGVNAFTYFFDKINPNPGNLSIEELKAYVEKLGDEVCKRAMDIALAEKHTGWSFIKAVLQRYARDGVRCIADAIESDAKWDKERRGGTNGTSKKPDTKSGIGADRSKWGIKSDL